MQLVAATRADLPFLAALRNEPVNAGFSKRGALTLEQIETDYFENPTKRVYIARSPRRAIGYAIFATRAADEVEISVALVPEVRGQGLGVALIQAATAFAHEHLSVTRVVALIRPDNAASLGAFAAAGYREARDRDGLAAWVSAKDGG